MSPPPMRILSCSALLLFLCTPLFAQRIDDVPHAAGVVEMIERKRRLIQQVHAVAGTEYIDVLEKLVALMYEKVQPYGQRV